MPVGIGGPLLGTPSGGAFWISQLPGRSSFAPPLFHRAQPGFWERIFFLFSNLFKKLFSDGQVDMLDGGHAQTS